MRLGEETDRNSVERRYRQDYSPPAQNSIWNLMMATILPLETLEAMPLKDLQDHLASTASDWEKLIPSHTVSYEGLLDRPDLQDDNEGRTFSTGPGAPSPKRLIFKLKPRHRNDNNWTVSLRAQGSSWGLAGWVGPNTGNLLETEIMGWTLRPWLFSTPQSAAHLRDQTLWQKVHAICKMAQAVGPEADLTPAREALADLFPTRVTPLLVWKPSAPDLQGLISDLPEQVLTLHISCLGVLHTWQCAYIPYNEETHAVWLRHVSRMETRHTQSPSAVASYHPTPLLRSEPPSPAMLGEVPLDRDISAEIARGDHFWNLYRAAVRIQEDIQYVLSDDPSRLHESIALLQELLAQGPAKP